MLCCRSPISERRFPHEKSSRSRCGFIDVQHIRFCSRAARSLFRPSSSFTHFVITPGTRRAPSSYAHAYRQSGADDAYPRSDRPCWGAHVFHAPWSPSFFRSCGAACLRASVPAASASLALRRLLRTPLRLPRCMVWVPRTLLLLPLSLWSLLPQILCIPRHPHQRETIKYDNVIRKKLRQQPELTLFRAKFYFPVFSSVQQRSYSSMASPTSSVHSELPM